MHLSLQIRPCRDRHGRTGAVVRSDAQSRVRSLTRIRIPTMNVGFRIPTRIDTEPAERRFDLRQYLNFVWRHWMFIGAVTALALLLAVIYLAARNSALHRDNPSPARAARESSKPGYRRRPIIVASTSRSFIENQLAILRSDSLLRRVVIKERLAVPPPTTKEPQMRADAAKEDRAVGGSRVHPRWNKSPAGSISGFAQRAGPGAQHCDHLGEIRSEPRSSPTQWRMPMSSTSSTPDLSRPNGPRVG